MISCKQREQARNETLTQFQALGIQPIVFQSNCEPASIQQLNATALEAIQYAAAAGKDMLFIEDDIDVNPERLKWALDNRKDAVTYLYLNDFDYRLNKHYGPELAKRIRKQEPIELGYYEIKEKFELFGTQCVLIPARLLQTMTAILKDGSQPMNPWDGRLLNWLQKSNERVYCVLPHPVQHRQVEVAWSKKRKVMKSMSYDIVVT